MDVPDASGRGELVRDRLLGCISVHRLVTEEPEGCEMTSIKAVDRPQMTPRSRYARLELRRRRGVPTRPRCGSGSKS